jgi:hypothetical protein
VRRGIPGQLVVAVGEGSWGGAQGSHGSAAQVAARAACRPVLGAHACSRRLHGAHVNLGIGGAYGPVGGRWRRPALHLRKGRVVLTVLAERYGLLVVAAAGLWYGGYWLGFNNGGGPRVPLPSTRRSD